jgi:hypothetical protein
VLQPLALNYANIIALPLLLGAVVWFKSISELGPPGGGRCWPRGAAGPAQRVAWEAEVSRPMVWRRQQDAAHARGWGCLTSL